MRSFSLGIRGGTCLSGKLRYCRLNPGKPFTGKLMAKPYRQGIAADSDAIGYLPIAKTRVGNLPSDFLVSHSYPPFVVVVVVDIIIILNYNNVQNRNKKCSDSIF